MQKEVYRRTTEIYYIESTYTILQYIQKTNQ